MEPITKKTKYVLEVLNNSGITKDFYLVKGTALALQIGHRLSIDLDWFSPNFKYNPNFRRKLSELGNLVINEELEDTFDGSLDGVRISFFNYPYPLIGPTIQYMSNVRLASKEDIAVMKLEAIAGRGSYKDFIDIYFLLQYFTLEEIFKKLEEKFKGLDYNKMHLIKSLNYFDDVKKGEMPQMIKDINWEEIKKEIRKATRQMVD